MRNNIRNRKREAKAHKVAQMAVGSEDINSKPKRPKTRRQPVAGTGSRSKTKN